MVDSLRSSKRRKVSHTPELPNGVDHSPEALPHRPRRISQRDGRRANGDEQRRLDGGKEQHDGKLEQKNQTPKRVTRQTNSSTTSSPPHESVSQSTGSAFKSSRTSRRKRTDQNEDSSLSSHSAQKGFTPVTLTTSEDRPVSSTKQAQTSGRRRTARTQNFANGHDGLGTDAIDELQHVDLKVPKSTAKVATTSEVETVKRVVIEQLTGKRPIRLHGLDEEKEKVRQLLQQTVRAGEGNSMLVIGSRGTGKTSIVNEILKELSHESFEHFHTVRLNGFVHTDDKLALREIWRQLGKEMDVEEESGSKNYADTLSKLLALLSHPSELSTGTEPEQVAKSVVFVLDEFDLFAFHPRQTLLYNLFDIAQSRKAPVAVLGLTTRVDVAESLEKRVKSRFSHRHVYLSLPKTAAAFEQICQEALQVRYGEHGTGKSVDVDIDCRDERLTLDTATSWNESVSELFHLQGLKSHLSRIYHTTRSVPTALTSLILPVSLLSGESPKVAMSSFNSSLLWTLLPPDSKLTILPSLSTLALAMLIAAARLDVVLDTDMCNFNMAYEEYTSLTNRARIAAASSSSASGSSSGAVGVGGKVWGREIARGMWEKLAETELLVPVAGSASFNLPAGGAAAVAPTDMVRCDVALEEIDAAVPAMERTLQSWCREI